MFICITYCSTVPPFTSIIYHHWDCLLFHPVHRISLCAVKIGLLLRPPAELDTTAKLYVFRWLLINQERDLSHLPKWYISLHNKGFISIQSMQIVKRLSHRRLIGPWLHDWIEPIRGYVQVRGPLYSSLLSYPPDPIPPFHLVGTGMRVSSSVCSCVCIH